MLNIVNKNYLAKSQSRKVAKKNEANIYHKLINVTVTVTEN